VQQEVDPDTLFFQRKLKINGDTELAHHVKNTIDTLDPEVIPGFMLTLMEQYKLRAFV
jgi:predicted lipid carrier protein YhbT